jgi:YfiH family protein
MTKHHFFGKNCNISKSLNDTDDLCEKLKNKGFDFKHKPLFLNQIHSDSVVVINSQDQLNDKALAKADAIVTNIKNLPICVVTADCVPLVFQDAKAQILAIAHSGWRGSKAGVIENTIKEMLKLGAKIEDIEVNIGPCIRQKSYEVSKEFFDDFIDENEGNRVFFDDSKKIGHFMFDLAGYCFLKLRNLGVKVIQDDQIDTYESGSKLFSYRRSTHKGDDNYGRNISIAMLSDQ